MPGWPVGSEQVRSPVLPGTRSPNRIRDTHNVPLRHKGSCACTGERMLARASWLTPKSPPLARTSKDLELPAHFCFTNEQHSRDGSGEPRRFCFRTDPATGAPSQRTAPFHATEQSGAGATRLLESRTCSRVDAAGLANPDFCSRGDATRSASGAARHCAGDGCPPSAKTFPTGVVVGCVHRAASLILASGTSNRTPRTPGQSRRSPSGAPKNDA